MRKFRLLRHSFFDAATNMAIDEAILESHRQGQCPSTLRFYGFTPAAVSLGYAQKISESQSQNILSQGYDIVIRPSGGRAVLHQGELTYSFVSSSEGVNDGVLAPNLHSAYKQISQALIFGINYLNASIEQGKAQATKVTRSDCFAATTLADLHVLGKKIIGSAQLRRNEAVLQHGSILLNQDQTLMPRLLQEEVEENFEHHANLYDIIGHPLALNDLENVIVTGFCQEFNCQFDVGKLTTFEENLVASLRPKYQFNRQIPTS